MDAISPFDAGKLKPGSDNDSSELESLEAAHSIQGSASKKVTSDQAGSFAGGKLKYPRNNFRPFRKVMSIVGKTVNEYSLVEAGDRIMVAISGGKDSLSMLSILIALKERAPIDFEIFAYTLDQGQPLFETSQLKAHYMALEVEHYIEKHDTFSVVQEKLEENQTPCSLCSRLRRGILYSEAQRLGANKIALGHHADDAFETLLMNMFYTGRLAAISPKLKSDDQKNIVIRPLIELEESMLQEISDHMNLPVIPCYTCDSGENMQRQRIKRLIDNEAKLNPQVRSSLKNALKNIQPRHLWDEGNFDFEKM